MTIVPKITLRIYRQNFIDCKTHIVIWRPSYLRCAFMIGSLFRLFTYDSWMFVRWRNDCTPIISTPSLCQHPSPCLIFARRLRCILPEHDLKVCEAFFVAQALYHERSEQLREISRLKSELQAASDKLVTMSASISSLHALYNDQVCLKQVSFSIPVSRCIYI